MPSPSNSAAYSHEHPGNMSFDDDASNGTTGAVSEDFVPESAPSNNKVFDGVEHAAPRKVAPQKVTFGPSDADGGNQFETKIAYRKADMIKNCEKEGCPNHGGKCTDHGKMYPMCKVKGCDSFRNRKGGFCERHFNIHGKPKDAANVGHAQHSKAAAAEAPGARKAPPPLGASNNDVVLSMTVESYKSTMYQKFKEVEYDNLPPPYAANQVFGGYCSQLDASGGSFFRMGRDGTFTKLSKKEAMKSIKRDISDRKRSIKQWGNERDQPNASGKKQARKDSVTGPNKKQRREGYVRTSNDLLLSKRDDETYKKRIEHASKKLWEEDGDPKAKANQLYQKWVAEREAKGGKLLKGSPAGRSSRIATKTEAIQKILDDLRAGKKKASSGKKSAPPNCNETDDTRNGPPKKLSSTRSSKGKKSSYPEQSPREYLAGFITNNILRMHPEVKAQWAMKRQCKGVGEDIWTASRVGEEEQFVGSDAILNEAYLSGLYDEFVLGEDEGWDKLERAGIQENPYCIFSDELKRERKRRKAAAKARSYGKSEPADDTSQLSHGSALIQDDDGETPQKNDEAFSIFNSEEKEFQAVLEDIASRYTSATAGNGSDSLAFYGYLLQYFKSKSSKSDFTLGPDKDKIADAVKEFEGAMEKVTSRDEADPLFSIYRDVAKAVINRCKAKLPLA